MESRCERLQHGVFTPGGAPSSRGAPPSSRGAPPSSARGAPPSLCGASPHDSQPPKHTLLATDIGRSFCDASAARSSRAVRDARASSSAVGVGELEAPRSACGRDMCAAHDGHRARPLVLRLERGALAARRVRRARELERLRVKHNNLGVSKRHPDHKCNLSSLVSLHVRVYVFVIALFIFSSAQCAQRMRSDGGVYNYQLAR